MNKSLCSLLPVLLIISGCMATGNLARLETLSTKRDTERRETLTVICWNINKQPLDTLGMDRLIAQHEPDLMCFQEATDDTFKGLDSRFADGFFGSSWRRLGSPTQHGTIIVSRYDLGAPAVFVSPVREFFWFTPKSALMSEVDWPFPEKLLVINVHALNFMPVIYLRDQLRVLSDAAAGHRGPMIVCGDFNTWNGARIKAVQQFAAKLGLVEALAYHRKGGTPSRWAYLVDPFIEIHMDATLDRIFCRGIQVLECRRLETFEGSDHPPILLQVKIR